MESGIGDLTQPPENDQLQLIKSYEASGKYEEAVTKGFSILDDNISDEKEDELFEILDTIMRCFLLKCNNNNNNASNVQHDYERLLSTLIQLNPLIIRYIHHDKHKQLITSVITHLGNCTLFLVRKSTMFDGELVLEFCDQMRKFGQEMCSSVCLHFNTFSVEILNCVLPLMAQACEIGQEKSLIDFLKLVDDVAIKCRHATDCCVKVQSIFNILASNYFPEVKELPVGPILKLYAMALSLNTVEQDLVKMDNGLRLIIQMLVPLKTTTPNLYFLAFKCLCEPVYRLIVSKQQDILFGHIKVPNIEHALQQFRRVCIKYRESKEGDVNKKDSETIATVAAASFILEFGTKNYSKETTEFLKAVLSADWIQTEDLKCLIDYLYKAGTTLNEIERTEEATESLKLCCQAASERIKYFCNSKDDDCLEGDIVHLVEMACKASSSMLKMRSEDGSNNVSWILTDLLRSWSLAQQVCVKIPPPKDLLKHWVHIICKEQGNEVSDSIPIVYSLMSSEISKEALGILVEQEIQVVKEVRPAYPKSCNAMLRIIINILYKDIYDTKDRLEESKNLTTRAKHFRECGVEFLAESESSMSEAISIMTDLYNERKGGHHLVCQLLAEAYCIRALCSQESKPNSKDLIEDVRHAVKLWSEQEHSKKSAEQTCTVFEKDLTLLYHVCDLLSLKGYLEIHSEIYETMIKCFNRKNLGLKDWWGMLLKSRSLGHGLCASPVNDVFMSTLSKLREKPTSMNFWTTCMETLELHTVGIQHNLFILPTLSSPDLYNRDRATQQKMSTTSNLIKNGPVTRHSLFVVAHIYYDLAETMIAKGSMIKALSYAKKAHSIRNELLRKTFSCSYESVKEILGANGEVIENKHVVTGFSMRSTVATAVWSHDKGGSADFEGFILTPWNLLQCYLESTMQFGNLVEYAPEAEYHLLTGKDISYILGLPIFSVSFSSALGKLYRKLQKWNFAEKELESAKSIWTANHSHISCTKCKTVLEVSINLELGDLYLERFYSKSRTGKELREADGLYRDAAEWLKRQEWVNSVSCPEEATARYTTFCDATGILSDTTPRGCEDNCWHCQPFQCMKSTSFQKCIDMKWEFIRRRLLLRLLTGKGCPKSAVKHLRWMSPNAYAFSNLTDFKWPGKCYAARGEIQDEKRVLFEGISILVSRSTLFREWQFHVTSNFVTTLIEKNLMGIAFSIEHASILYQICCHFLKCIGDEDTSYTISKPTLVSGLKLAFILSREVPTLHQKVSRILSVLYTSDKELSTCNDLSANQWASYFHKSSIGTYLNNAIVDRAKDHMTVISSCLPTAHSSVKDLEESVLQFYKELPSVAILCISLLGDNSDGLLGDLLPYSPVSAWIMLSRLNSTSMPIVVILPVGSIFTDSGSSISFTKESPVNPWRCPWAGDTVTDKVAPMFKSILEELKRIEQNRKGLVTRFEKLDQCLSELLSDMENKWFGRWKQLLCGEWSDYKNLDCRLQDLLRSEYNIEVDTNIVRVVLEGAGKDTPKEEFLSELISSKGCYIARSGSHDKSIDKDRFAPISKIVSKTLSKMRETGSNCRKPIILVLDLEIQMLPFESMAVLRNQDIYRMPSVISIFSTFYKNCSRKDMSCMVFPTIDPRDSYYLLNPQGDLRSLEETFQTWFQKLNLVGEVGTSSTQVELTEVLRSRDLFIYIGHGSGLDCISAQKIGKLDRCAAILLMGCSSGTLRFQGPYIPDGVVLDYILAGAPVIVCNLWDVVVTNANKLTTALLRSWIISKDKENIGLSMGNARDACYAPHIQGGSLVCYGIPTGIKKKDM